MSKTTKRTYSVDYRDEYARLKTAEGTFYFGIDTCDDEGEWYFTFTKPDGTVVCSLTVKDLGVDDTLCYDDAPDVILAGIGHCIQEGWLRANV